MAVPLTLGVILAGGLSRRMGGGDKVLLRLGGRTLLERVVERLAPQCAAGLVLSANGDVSRFSGFPGPIMPDGVPGNPGPLAGILAALDFAADAPQQVSSHSRPHPEVRGEAEPRRRPPDRAEGSGALLRGRFAVPQDEAEGGSEGRLDLHRGPVVEHVVSVSGDAPFLPHDLVVRLHAKRQIAKAPLAFAASGGHRHYTVALWSVLLRTDLREALVVRDERRVGAFIAAQRAVEVCWPTEPFDPFLNINTPDDLAVAEALLAMRCA